MVLTEKTKIEDRNSLFYPVIEKLQFEYKSPQLGQLIKNELNGQSPSHSDMFFIKSEIKRKAQPCSRLIDLRSLSTEASLSTFTWDKLSHVLDKSSAEHFVSLTRKYGGIYTFGVYEGVISHFKSTKHRVKDDKFNNEISIDKVSLCEVYRRHEERMNLGVKVIVFPRGDNADSVDNETIEQIIKTELKDINKEEKIEGNTANISVTGLQIRLQKNLSIGELIAVRFAGLESDFVFEQKLIAYKVVRSDLVDEGKIHLISLSQIDLDVHDEFKQFTKRIIYSNKKRYKVRLDNTLVSVRSKFFEQFYLSRRNALDIFARNDGTLPYIFSSEPALDMIDWFTVRGAEYLSSLMLKDNIKVFAPEEKEIYWVVLKKASTKESSEFSYYSSVVSDELSLKFALYALKSGHGKIFKISFTATGDKKPFVTSSLPRSIHRKMGGDNIYRYSPELKSLLKGLKKVYTLKELNSEDIRSFAKNGEGISKEELLLCSQYLLKQKPASQSDVVRLESNDYRKEDRFNISTPLSVTYESEVFEGATIDVSSRGLAIELVNEASLNVGAEISVSLDVLNQSETEFDLTKLPYKVVYSKGKLLRLEASQKKGIVGIKFWNKYISTNLDSLKIVGNNEKFYGLKRAFRNIVSQSYNSVPAFFTVKDSKPCVRTLGLSNNHMSSPIWSSVFKTFSIDTQLKSMFYDKLFLKKLLLDLPKINKVKPFCHYFLLIKYQQNKNGKLDIDDVIFLPEANTLEELNNELEGYEFEFTLFNVSLTKKSRIFDRYYKDEMRYLEAYAAHKAKKLNFEIKTVSGVLDFEDVTSFYNLFTMNKPPKITH